MLRVRLRMRLIVISLTVRMNIGFLSGHYQMLLLKAEPKKTDSPSGLSHLYLLHLLMTSILGPRGFCCWVSEHRWRCEAFALGGAWAGRQEDPVNPAAQVTAVSGGGGGGCQSGVRAGSLLPVRRVQGVDERIDEVTKTSRLRRV